MEAITLLALLSLALFLTRQREQQRRIVLLSGYLGPYQIERQMEQLLDGYLRWLGEDDPERRQQIRGVLAGVEQSLAAQFTRFAADVQQMEAPLAQVSKLPLWVPFAQPLLPGRRLFDVRKAFAIHARGIEAAAANALQLAPKAQAFMMSAELLLMQHTCHWFCRSRSVASARLIARHQTSYAQALDAVSPQTRADYLALVSR